MEKGIVETGARDRRFLGVVGLKTFLEDPLHLARLLQQHRWSELLAVAELAEKDVDPDLAFTDPQLYSTLRRAITLFHLKGYRVLDRNALADMVRETRGSMADATIELEDVPTSDVAMRVSGPAALPSIVESWLALQNELLRENQFETGPELGWKLGSRAKNTSEFVSKMRREGRIFAVEAGGQDLFPLFQFHENKPIPAIAPVLEALTPKLSNWAILSWFCIPNEWACSGKMPKELLETDPDAVIEAARHLVAPSWD